MNDWLDVAQPFIEAQESLSLVAYPDPISRGDPYTIGYGATGNGITKGTVWTQQQANEDLCSRLEYTYKPALDACVKVSVNVNQIAAMLSLMYNIGIHAFQNSTMVRLLNAGDVHGTAAQFLVWDKAGGNTIQGLLNRRYREQKLFMESV